MSSPSAARRQALKSADASNQLPVLESYPLSKYLDVTEQLLARFQYAVDERKLDEAYIYGLRFANLSVEALPKHPEWKRPTTSAKRKKKLASQVDKVLSMMEVLITRMDAEELAKEKAIQMAKQEEEFKKRQEEERQKELVDSQRRKEREQRDALEEERQKYMAQQQSERKQKEAEERQQKKQTIEQSAMAKLLALGAKPKPSEASTAPSKSKPNKKDANTKKEAAKPIAPAKATKPKQKIPVPVPVPSKTTESKPTAKPAKTQPSKMSEQETSSSSIQPKASAKPQKPSEGSNSELSQETEEPIVPAKGDRSMPPAAPATVASKKEKAPSKATKHTTTSSKPEKGRREKLQESSTVNDSTRSVSTIQKSTVVEEHRPQEIETHLGTVQKTGDSSRYMLLSPATAKEQRTIQLLQQNIDAQEQRLEEIENVQIPYLLKTAKAHLKEKNQPEALKCVAHKKRLDQQVDVIKASVFNMETQMFMIESAMEDRHVKKALNEAASAISGLQHSIGDPNAEMIDLTQMNLALPSADEMDYETDDELMEELQDWVSPEEKRRKEADSESDRLSILSLPSVPDSLPSNGSTREILRAVLG